MAVSIVGAAGGAGASWAALAPALMIRAATMAVVLKKCVIGIPVLWCKQCLLVRGLTHSADIVSRAVGKFRI